MLSIIILYYKFAKIFLCLQDTLISLSVKLMFSRNLSIIFNKSFSLVLSCDLGGNQQVLTVKNDLLKLPVPPTIKRGYKFRTFETWNTSSTKKVMISTKNIVLTNSRIHDGASDPRKTVAPFHSFYGHGRRTSRGPGGPVLFFCRGGGGWKI